MKQLYLLKQKLKIYINISKFISEFSGFSLAAIFSFFIDFVFFLILNFIGINFLIAQSIARLSGGATSFYINKNFSFKNVTNTVNIQLRRIVLLYIISYCLSLLLISFIHKNLNFELIFAKFSSDFICFLFNFCVMKVYVYRNFN